MHGGYTSCPNGWTSTKRLYQSEEEVLSDFAGAGWTLASRDEITWLRSASLAEDLREAEAASHVAFRTYE